MKQPYGLVNGDDGIFEDFTETISKYFVWIHFHNHRIGHNTQIKIYKSMMNSQGLTNNGHQLNLKLLKYK
jgi:hypothetical protein